MSPVKVRAQKTPSRMMDIILMKQTCSPKKEGMNGSLKVM